MIAQPVVAEGLSALLHVQVVAADESRSLTGSSVAGLERGLLVRLEQHGEPVPVAASAAERRAQAEALFALIHEVVHARSQALYVFPDSEFGANRRAADTFRFWARRWFGDLTDRLWRALPEQWQRPQGVVGP